MTLTVDLILAIVAALVLGWWVGWWGRGSRIKKQSFDAQIAAYERTIEKRHTPQHARTAPLHNPLGLPPARPQIPGQASPHMQIQPPWQQPRRSHTSPADIATVFLPGRPQPARTSGAGTQTLPRLTDTSRAHIPGTPKLTDTGELRLRAQAYIDKMAADDVEWRAKTGLLT